MLFILLEESRVGFTLHGTIEAASPEEAAKSIGSVVVRVGKDRGRKFHRLIEDEDQPKGGFYLFESFPCECRPEDMGPVRKIKMVPVEVE